MATEIDTDELGRPRAVMPIRIVTGLIAADEAGRAVSVKPIRYVDGTVDTATGVPIGVVPVRVLTDLITADEAGNAVPVMPVRVVTEPFVANEVGARVAAMPVRLVDSAAQTIGGAEVGSAGTPGTIYEGYTLSWGDEFNSLDILSPTNSRGRYFTTRTYLPGARGSDTLLGTMFDTDPFMTGHLDSNRGVPVGYDNMSAVASVLRLQARRATTEEKAHFSAGAAGGRQQVAAMIAGPGAVHFYPGPENTGDVIYEARLRFSAAAGNPSGWHPTMWSQSLNPTIAIESDEMDWEGNADNIGFGYNRWTSGAGTGTAVGARIAHDGAWHTITMILSQGKIQLYRDGVLYASSAVSANTKNKPQYPLLTNHIYNGTFEGDTYSQAQWDADADGALLEVDYCRIWRRTGRQHFKPLASLSDVNVDYGSSVTITLPSAVALWGDGTVTEYLQVVYNEENEPGVSHTSVFARFPAGVTYNSTTREVAVNITSGGTGRMNFVLSAWKNDGATGEPLRFAVNVGPVINIANTMDYTVGEAFSFDLYAACDCGVLVTDGTARNKTMSVTGLPVWASYNDSTGLITGMPTDTGSSPLSISVTNSLGQSATKAVTLQKAAAAVTSFSDNFNRPTGTTLESTGNWTLVSGTSGLAQSSSTGRMSASATSTINACLMSPDIGSLDQFIEFDAVNNQAGPAVCMRLTALLTALRISYVGNEVAVSRTVNGTFGATTTYTSTFVVGNRVRVELVGDNFRVSVNGVRLTPNLGTETIAGAGIPATTRQGLSLRTANLTIDNYSTGQLPTGFTIT